MRTLTNVLSVAMALMLRSVNFTDGGGIGFMVLSCLWVVLFFHGVLEDFDN